jgi:hypothetical protein
MREQNPISKSDHKLEAQAELFASSLHPIPESLEEYEIRVKENNIIQKKIKSVEDLFNITKEEKENMLFGPYFRELEEQNALLVYARELSEIKDLYHLPESINPALRQLIETYRDKYVAFLRREKNLETLFIEKNRIIWDKKYKNTVRELKEKIKKTEPEVGIDDCISVRERSFVFKKEIDGATCFIKIYNKDAFRELSTGMPEIQALMRTEDIPRVSHLVAYSYEEGAHILTPCPGNTTNKLNPEEINYSDEDLKILLTTIKQLNERGISLDIDSTNILYSKEESFYVIDYHLPKETDSPLLLKIKEQLSSSLLASLDNQNSLSTPEKKAIFIHLDKRLISIIENNFPDLVKEFGSDFQIWKMENKKAIYEV